MSVRLYHREIQQHIENRISTAQTELKIAMAWFTHKQLFQLLLNLRKNNIKLELIILNDEVNFRLGGIDFQAFINAGGALYISATGKKLHHKFCIIDGNSLITGSYNWTYQAERNNHENILVAIDETKLSESLLLAFEEAKKDATKVEDISRFHEMYPPQTSEQHLQNYLAEDLAEMILDEGDELELDLVSKLDITNINADTYNRLSENAYMLMSKALQQSINEQGSAFRHLVTLYHNWTAQELKICSSCLDKLILLKNKIIKWTPEIIRAADFNEDEQKQLWWYGKFENLGTTLAEMKHELPWRWLSLNEQAEWTPNLLEEFKDFIQWDYFSMFNKHLLWDKHLFERFQDKISWSKVSRLSNVTWSQDLIETYFAKLDFGTFSENRAIPWTEVLFERLKSRLNLKFLSANTAFCWKEELVIAHENQWDWQKLFQNEGMCWNENLIKRYHQKSHKDLLFRNTGIQWTAAMLEGLSDWLDTYNINYINGWGALSIVDSPWKTAKILQRFSGKFHLGYICDNRTLDWSQILKTDLTEKLLKHWQLPNTIHVGLQGLAHNPTFPWDEQLIISYLEPSYDRANLIQELVTNEGFKKSRTFVDKYETEINFSALSYQKNISWSADLLEKYHHRLNWDTLSANEQLEWNADMLTNIGINWNKIANNKSVFDHLVAPEINTFILRKIFTLSVT